MTLATVLRAGIVDALWTVEDELAGGLDVALGRALTGWTAVVDGPLHAGLLATYGSGFRQFSESSFDDAQARWWAATRVGLLGVPARLVESVRAAQGPAAAVGASVLAAARDAVEGLTSQADWRAERIADTLTTSAVHAGFLDALLAESALTGESYRLVWHAHDDERTRESHVALDGTSVAVGASFLPFVTLRYPGDVLCPDLSEVVNCRCHLTVELSDLTASGGVMPKPALADVTGGTSTPVNTLPGTEPVYTGLPDGFRGCLAPLNRKTADHRLLKAPEVARGRRLPMELRAVMEATGGHDGATMIGAMDSVWVQADCPDSGGACLHAEGPLDLGGENGAEWARRLGDNFASQVSIDPVDVTVEYRYFTPEGVEVPEPTSYEEYVELMTSGAEEVAVFTDWALGAATLVGVPALSAARLSPVWGYTREHGDEPYQIMEDPQVITAALGTVYDERDFMQAEPDCAQPLRIRPDGRVTGHVAQWGVCHLGIQGTCTMAPKSRTSYAHFHVGSVLVDRQGEVEELPVGKITLGGGHAGPRQSLRAAQQHYDDTGSAVAVVRVKDGKHGIWLSGRLLPGLSDHQVDELRRSPLSGDWRRIGGSLEMVAALAVNVPGYTIPHTIVASAAAEQISLVAAGVVAPPAETPADLYARGLLTPDEARALARDVARELRLQEQEEARVAALAERIAPVLRQTEDERVAALAARVNQEV